MSMVIAIWIILAITTGAYYGVSHLWQHVPHGRA